MRIFEEYLGKNLRFGKIQGKFENERARKVPITREIKINFGFYLMKKTVILCKLLIIKTLNQMIKNKIFEILFKKSEKRLFFDLKTKFFLLRFEKKK